MASRRVDSRSETTVRPGPGPDRRPAREAWPDRPPVSVRFSERVAQVWRRALAPTGGGRGPRRPEREPTRATWSRVLGVCLAAFALWLLLDAPTLEHNAQVSPIGTRRSVSLSILRPIAALSRDLGVSHLVSVADGLIGRNGNHPGNGQAITAPPPKRHRVGQVSTTTTPPNTVNRHPTAANPLRVLVLGDSLGIDLGDVLVNDLTQTGVCRATLDGQVSTGLTRPDYFNWPAELASDLSKDDPQVVVVMIGANDAQDLPGPPDIPFGTPAWLATYRSRVESFMGEATSEGASLIWVGMPPMQNGGLSSNMQTLNGIVQAAAKERPGVQFVDSWNLLGTSGGQYTPYLVVNGQEVNVREPDGTHITPGGAQILSEAVENSLENALKVSL